MLSCSNDIAFCTPLRNPPSVDSSSAPSRTSSRPSAETKVTILSTTRPSQTTLLDRGTVFSPRSSSPQVQPFDRSRRDASAGYRRRQLQPECRFEMRAPGAHVGWDGTGASGRRPRAPADLSVRQEVAPDLYPRLPPRRHQYPHVTSSSLMVSDTGAGRPMIAMLSRTHNCRTIPRNCAWISFPIRVGRTTRCTFTGLCETSHRRTTRTVRNSVETQLARSCSAYHFLISGQRRGKTVDTSPTRTGAVDADLPQTASCGIIVWTETLRNSQRTVLMHTPAVSDETD